MGKRHCFHGWQELEIIHQAIRSIACEHRHFFFGCERSDISALSFLSSGNMVRPSTIVFLRSWQKTLTGSLKTKRFFTIPAAETMVFGRGQKNRITESSADSTIDNRQRRTSSSRVCQNAMNEELARIAGLILSVHEVEIVLNAHHPLQAFDHGANTNLSFRESSFFATEPLDCLPSEILNPIGPFVDLINSQANQFLIHARKARQHSVDSSRQYRTDPVSAVGSIPGTIYPRKFAVL